MIFEPYGNVGLFNGRLVQQGFKNTCRRRTVREWELVQVQQRLRMSRWNLDAIDETIYKLKTEMTMKELIEILTDENKSFNFPWWVYMFVMPAALVLLMAIAGWMDALSQGL